METKEILDKILAKERFLDPYPGADRERRVAEISFKAGYEKGVIAGANQQRIRHKKAVDIIKEGYKAMAEENRLLAEQSLPIALETWPKQSDDS